MSREQWGHGYRTGYLEGIKSSASFYDYAIAMHDGEDTAEGDFVHDMKQDPRFPKPTLEPEPCGELWVPSKMDIVNHLRHDFHACTEAFLAFENIWKEWEQYTKR